MCYVLRWKVIGEDDAIQYGPFPVPKGGLPVHVYRRTKDTPETTIQHH